MRAESSLKIGNKEKEKGTRGANKLSDFTIVKSLVFLVALVMLSSMVWADSNGVWHEAEDVRGTVFGADEGYPNYIFNSTVEFAPNGNLEMNDNNINNVGKINMQGKINMNNNSIEQVKYIYGNRFYDRDDTSYAVEPAAASNMNILRVYGKLNMNGNNINNIGKIGNVDSTDMVGNLNSDMVDGQDWANIKNWVNSNDDVGITSESDPVWNSEKSNYATKTYVDERKEIVQGLFDRGPDTRADNQWHIVSCPNNMVSYRFEVFAYGNLLDGNCGIYCREINGNLGSSYWTSRTGKNNDNTWHKRTCNNGEIITSIGMYSSNAQKLDELKIECTDTDLSLGSSTWFPKSGGIYIEHAWHQAKCPKGYVLTGIKSYAKSQLENIQPLCSKIN